MEGERKRRDGGEEKEVRGKRWGDKKRIEETGGEKRKKEEE
jgi:hypothetical protein